MNGLTNEEVKTRINNNLTNRVENHFTKSTKDIIIANTFTFFNIINIILFILVILVQSYKNGLFIILIIINTLTGIYQELKTKKVLDKLAILTTSKVRVIRNGEEQNIFIEDVVMDDLIVLKTGFQVPSDAIIIEGSIELNESLLTGEFDPVYKNINSEVLSGSFVTSGNAIAKVVRVGSNNYVHSITKEAKKQRKANSELNNEMNKILKIISIIILPVCSLLFLKSYFISDLGLYQSTIKTVAAALGMVPEGMILLTTVALASSVYKLSKQNTLVRELFCVESLARVDTLCLDKTGTITEGKMVVDRVKVLDKSNVSEIMGNLLYNLKDENITSIALKKYYEMQSNYEVSHVIPFSSDRKYSGVSFKGLGTYYIGAKEFVLKKIDKKLERECEEYAKEGYRILILAHSNVIAKDEKLVPNIEPIAIILVTDIIRKNVTKTIDFFKKEDVNIKVISGDDAITVAAIAKKAGIPDTDKYIDATSLTDYDKILKAVQDYNIFGRVTPIQKKQMIMALKQLGKTVAMTGDGVNDCLAFKEADVSIAMASGNDAARSAANLVLLDNNFDAMPSIIYEGRKVVNNIACSSSMYVIKTMFSVLIALITVLIGEIYPFEPIHLSIINACCVAIPTFFLTYEPNYSRIKGDFMNTVIKNAFPAALSISILATLVMNLGLVLGESIAALSTICVLLTGWNYMLALERLYSPMNDYRKMVIYGSELIYFVLMIIGKDIIGLTEINYIGVIVLLIIGHYSDIFYNFFEKVFIILSDNIEKIIDYLKKLFNKTKEIK